MSPSPRTIHAIEFILVAKQHLSFIVWPGQEPPDACARLVDQTSQSWLTLMAGDEVLMSRETADGGETWAKKRVKAVRLFRVNPTEWNGATVESAQKWLAGE